MSRFFESFPARNRPWPAGVNLRCIFGDQSDWQNRTVIVSVRPVARRECERRKAAGLTRARAHTLEDELSGVRPSSRDPQLARRPPASADDALDPGGKFKLLMIAAY